MPQAFFIFTTVFTFKFELPTLSDTFAEHCICENPTNAFVNC